MEKENNQKKVTIIITMENQSVQNKRCIESILTYCNLDMLEIVVIDNHSNDAEREWTKSQDYLTYVYFEEGEASFAKRINDTIRELNICNDFIILDSTFFMKEDIISKINNAVHQNDNIGTVSPLFACELYEFLFKMSIDEHLAEEYEFSSSNLHNVMTTQPYAIYISYELWKKTGGFCEKLYNSYVVMMDFQLKALKNGLKNTIMLNSYLHTDNKVSVLIVDGATYDSDMKEMENMWGMHYFNTLPNNDLVKTVAKAKADKKTINVLEIGCDLGATLLGIKNVFSNANVYGLELNESAVKIAQFFANARQCNIETDGIPFNDIKFDVIIFGDVLEHLRNPEDIIKMCKAHLNDDGCIVSSIPNVQHISVLLPLIYGRFTYTDTGLLDKTHIHLFTLYEIQQMFSQAGYRIEHLEGIRQPITNIQLDAINKLKTAFPEIDEKLMIEFQFIVCARKSE